MMKHQQALVIVLGLTVTASCSIATPILFDYEDGENIAFSDWAIEEVNAGTVEGAIAGEPGAGTTVGANNNAISITADTAGDITPRTDVIFTTAFNPGGGADMNSYGPYSTDIAGIRFDFYAGANGDGTGAPIDLGFYFSTTDNEVWYYTISGIADGWNTYFTYFDYNYGSGWYGYSDNTWGTDISSQVEFDAAIANVDRIGLYITYQTDLDGQQYGIDDFGLTVPEPETYMVLGMALLSVAVVFRKRITESLAEARSVMQI